MQTVTYLSFVLFAEATTDSSASNGGAAGEPPSAAASPDAAALVVLQPPAPPYPPYAHYDGKYYTSVFSSYSNLKLYPSILVNTTIVDTRVFLSEFPEF